MASNGMLLQRDEDNSKKYLKVEPQAPEGDGPKQKIIWAKLKRPERAIEKVLRAYGGDVSKLCDICRQSIVRQACHSPGCDLFIYSVTMFNVILSHHLISAHERRRTSQLRCLDRCLTMLPTSLSA